MGERLTDEIDSNHFFPSSHELQRRGAGNRRADIDTVQALDRYYAWAGAGGERLVGTIHVVGREIAFDDRDPELARDRKERRARDSAEHGPAGRGTEPATMYEKEIAQVGLRDIAIQIEHQRGGAWIDLPRLECRDRVVHLICDLGLRLEALRRRSAGRRRDQQAAFDILAGEAVVGDRQAEERDSRGHCPPLGESIYAAADDLPHGAIIVRIQEMLIALEDLDGEPRHLIGRDAGIDTRILQGAIEPSNVLVELEELVTEAARDVIDALTAGKASVEDRDLGFARRYEGAIDVAKSLFHRTPS